MELYPIVKTLHIISFTAWMAGMFYLPRLFAYHVAARKNASENTTFKVMEARLYRFIMRPAMLATWGFGIWLASLIGYGTKEPGQWLTYKIGLVLLLTALHGYFGVCIKRFERDEHIHGSAFYKTINELATVLFVGIVIMVVIRPTL